MNCHKKTSLLCLAVVAVLACGSAAAATVGSALSVDATLDAACEVSATSAIDFSNFDALASTGARDANSGTSFQVACTTGVAPMIYATGTRSMMNGLNALPFSLSLTAGGVDDLAASSATAQALAITQDGTMQNVVVYSRVLASNFASLPAGDYNAAITVSVDY